MKVRKKPILFGLKTIFLILAVFIACFGISTGAYADEISATMNICDGESTMTDNINGEKSILVSVDIDGKRSSASQVYFAAYDANGRLIAVQKKSVDSCPTTVLFKIELDGSSIQTPKVFIWDNMTPLIKDITDISNINYYSGAKNVYIDEWNAPNYGVKSDYFGQRGQFDLKWLEEIN